MGRTVDRRWWTRSVRVCVPSRSVGTRKTERWVGAGWVVDRRDAVPVTYRASNSDVTALQPIEPTDCGRFEQLKLADS
jgi:hypothetical protein